MATVLQTVIGCLLVVSPACLAEYIYFSTAGGPHRPGVYGGPISTDDRGSAGDLYVSGYQCAVLPQELDYSFDTLNMRSISYDPVSKNMLMHLTRALTLLRSPVCRAQPPNCNTTTRYISPIFIERQFSEDIKPVAYYDSTVYFLSYKTETINTREKDAILELRKFEGCEASYPITSNAAFDLDLCTKTMATIREERYEHSPAFKTADHLIVIRDGSQPRFFTVIQHFTYEKRKMLSYAMQLVTVYNNQVDVLHEETLSPIFNMFLIEQIGGISFRDNVLCWSVISKILCADWRNSNIQNVRYVLEDGQAQAVCKGTSDKQTYNITTGVAIASVNPLVLYFGCMSQISGKGGMGMIRVKSDGSREILNVTSGGQPVLAGSMFITTECKSAKPKPSNGHSNNISGGTQPSGNSGAGSSGLGAPEEGESISHSGAPLTTGLLIYAHALMVAIFVSLLV